MLIQQQHEKYIKLSYNTYLTDYITIGGTETGIYSRLTYKSAYT